MNPKLGVLLLFLFLTIPPVWVLRGLANVEVPDGAHVAEQPGGKIRGVVRSRSGEALAGVEVRVDLVNFADRGRRGGRGALRGTGGPGALGGAPGAPGGSDPLRRIEHGVVETGVDGTFEFDVPPHDGFYGVVAGGGFWQRKNQNFSYFDGGGQPREPEEVVLELEPAGALRVTAVNEPWTHQAMVVLREARGGRSRGIAMRRATWDEEILELDAIPPGSYRVEIEHPGGLRTTHDVEIVAGRFEVLEVDLSDL